MIGKADVGSVLKVSGGEICWGRRCINRKFHKGLEGDLRPHDWSTSCQVQVRIESLHSRRQENLTPRAWLREGCNGTTTPKGLRPRPKRRVQQAWGPKQGSFHDLVGCMWRPRVSRLDPEPRI